MTDTTTAAPPPAGHNKPPLVTADGLAKDHDAVITALNKYDADARELPPVCEDAEDVEAHSKFVRLLDAASKRLEVLRPIAKEEFLEATRIVDGWFGIPGRNPKGLQKRIADHVLRSTGIVHAFQLRQREAEQKRLAAEQARLRKEEDDRREQAIRDAAAAANAPEAVAARAIAEAAAKAEADRATLAAAAPPPVTAARTIGADGSTAATLEEEWVFQIENHSALDVVKLRNHFSPSEISAAIARYIKNGGRQLDGVRIYSVPKTKL